MLAALVDVDQGGFVVGVPGSVRVVLADAAQVLGAPAALLGDLHRVDGLHAAAGAPDRDGEPQLADLVLEAIAGEPGAAARELHLIEQDQPVGMLWDMQVFDLDGWIIPEGLSDERLAQVLDFVYFGTDTQRLADQSKYISYGPARASSALRSRTEASRWARSSSAASPGRT